MVTLVGDITGDVYELNSGGFGTANGNLYNSTGAYTGTVYPLAQVGPATITVAAATGTAGASTLGDNRTIDWTYQVSFADAVFDTLDTGDTMMVTFTVSAGSYTYGGSVYDRQITITLHGLDEVCFTRGTMIKTPYGQRPIEDLAVGDPVNTLTNGVQNIKWIGHSKVSADRRRGNSELEPVEIATGALGDNLPNAPLRLSRQHRVLIEHGQVECLFGENAVLSTAKSLMNGKTVYDCADKFEDLEYWHMMFDDHEIVYANGMPVESLYLGDQALDTLNNEQVKEIKQLVPQAFEADFTPELCYPSLKTFETAVLRRAIENESLDDNYAKSLPIWVKSDRLRGKSLTALPELEVGNSLQWQFGNASMITATIAVLGAVVYLAWSFGLF